MRVPVATALVLGSALLLGCELVAGIEEQSLETTPPCSPGNIDQLTDDFDDGDLNPLWTGGGYSVQETNGQLRFDLSPAGQADYSDIESIDAYSLRECQITLEIVEAPAYPSAPANFSFTVGQDGENQLFITVGASAAMIFGITADGVGDDSRRPGFSLARDRWWRIREQGNTVYVETSPDAVEWAVGHRADSPSYVEDVHVGFWAGTFEPHADPGAVAVDNINLLP